MSFVSDKIVTAAGREALFDAMPALAYKPYALFLGHLAFGTSFSTDTGNLLIGARTLAKIDGKTAQWQQNNFESGKFIAEFCEATGIRINHTPFDSDDHAREVIEALYPAGVVDTLRAESEVGYSESMVYLASGRKNDRFSRCAERKELKSALIPGAANNALSNRLLDLLNTQSSNGFSFSLEVLQAAFDKILDYKDLRMYKAGTYDQQLRCLRAVQQQGMPFYQPSDKGVTARVFGVKEGLLNLKSDLRPILAPDWLEFDIRNCQLAINAADWGGLYELTRILNSLGEKESMWDYYAKELNEIKTPKFKGVLKDNNYALPYGREVHYAERVINQGLGGDLGTRFVQLPVIVEMVNRRDELNEQLWDEGGWYDEFGQRLSTDDHKPGSILACRSQSKELALLEPIIDLAERSRAGEFGNHGFEIRLYQFDGFSISVQHSDDGAMWTKRLQDAFQENVDRLGITTRLELKAA